MTERNTSRSPSGASDACLTPGRFGLALGLLIFVSFPEVLVGLETFAIRDFGLFSYPVAFFQRECFWRGELPLWNPYSSCGVPFLAQWNTMPLYPPALLYLLLPLSWSLGFFCLAHLWFGGLGMYFLAHCWTGNRLAASVAGLGFAFSGLSLSLLVWPSHIATLSWMPWVVWKVQEAWQQGGGRLILAALTGAMQMLAGGPETILLTWLVLAALWLSECAALAPKRQGRPQVSDAAELGLGAPSGARLWRFGLIVALVALLAAAQLLPFLDLAAHSQRQEGYADTRWSLPGRGWANFLVPMAFGSTWNQDVFFQYGQYWISSYYPGVGIVLLAAWAVWTVRERRVRLLALLSISAFLLALGDQTFIHRGLRHLLPQLTLMTYPVKFMVVIAFSAPLLVAFALARWRSEPCLESVMDPPAGDRNSDIRNPKQIPRLKAEKSKACGLDKRFIVLAAAVGALIGLILLWAGRFPKPEDDFRATWINGVSRAGFLTAIIVLLALLKSAAPRLRQQMLSWVLLFVLWLDLKTHVPSPNPTVPTVVYAPGVVRAEQAMEPEPALGESRVMVSPAADRILTWQRGKNIKTAYVTKRLAYFCDCNLLDEVPKVNGFFSLVPREHARLANLLYYSTNAPPARLVDFLSVSHLTAPGELDKFEPRPTSLPEVMAGQQPVFLDDTNTLAELMRPNFDGGKVVFLPPESLPLVSVTNGAVARVLSHWFGLREVQAEVQAAEPSLVTVSQTYYHCWRAYVDGKPVPLVRANYAFQALEVPAGLHRVRLAYQDRSFQLGTAVSLLTLLSSLVVFFRWRRVQSGCARRPTVIEAKGS